MSPNPPSNCERSPQEAASSRFTAVEHAKQNDPVAIVTVLEDVRRAGHFQDELPVLFTSRERPAKPRMAAQNLRFGDDLFSDDRRQLRRLFVKKRGKSIEV